MRTSTRIGSCGTWQRAGLVVAASLACAPGVATAQVMLSNPAPTRPVAPGPADPAAGLRPVSLLLVEPPKPREFAIHDKVTIVIAESSRQASSQTLDTKKDQSFKAALNKFPDLRKLVEAELTNGASSPIASVDVGANNKFKGEGKYDRTDQFTDRLTATIIDVKPNGVLVIEAKRTIQKDEEKQTIVLCGECRREDVSPQNTVLSSQLAELTLISRNEGQVKESATKGLIPRLFEALFNF